MPGLGRLANSCYLVTSSSSTTRKPCPRACGAESDLGARSKSFSQNGRVRINGLRLSGYGGGRFRVRPSSSARACTLPAPVTLIEERTVGPALGRDSIRQGNLSFAVGGSAVAPFVLVYYRFAGVLAVCALVLNMVYLVAALAGFGGRLTLPGIGGLS